MRRARLRSHRCLLRGSEAEHLRLLYSRPMSARTKGPRIVALLNQKGGVGKTTTTVNLGAGLAAAGLRTLLVDMDPQSNLSLHFGVEADDGRPTTSSLFADPPAGLIKAAVTP